MALTPTTDIALGFKAPEFELPEPKTGDLVDYPSIRGEKATVVMFICNHCPYVIHIKEALVQLANDYLSKGIGFVAINSNDVVNYPDDSPERMVEDAIQYKYPFPYLFDESQAIAKAYDAACTPDFSVFDADDKCVYRGQIDSSRPNSGIPVTAEDMRRVLDDLITTGKYEGGQRPSMGCNIKWKA